MSLKQYDNDRSLPKKPGLCGQVTRGDPWCLRCGKNWCQITLDQNQHNYDRLNVTLKKSDTMGESIYNPILLCGC